MFHGNTVNDKYSNSWPLIFRSHTAVPRVIKFSLVDFGEFEGTLLTIRKDHFNVNPFTFICIKHIFTVLCKPFYLCSVTTWETPGYNSRVSTSFLLFVMMCFQCTFPLRRLRLLKRVQITQIIHRLRLWLDILADRNGVYLHLSMEHKDWGGRCGSCLHYTQLQVAFHSLLPANAWWDGNSCGHGLNLKWVWDVARHWWSSSHV